MIGYLKREFMKAQAVKRVTYIVIALFSSGYVFAQNEPYTQIEQSCPQNQATQQERSKELAELAAADQNDRVNFFSLSQEEMKKVLLSDLKRRMRVGELFGEGCMISADDYMNGAIIY